MDRNPIIPTRSDWGEVDPDDLDAQWALEQFLGKSFADAEEFFATNALYYGEALESMPPVPFNFYGGEILGLRPLDLEGIELPALHSAWGLGGKLLHGADALRDTREDEWGTRPTLVYWSRGYIEMLDLAARPGRIAVQDVVMPDTGSVAARGFAPKFVPCLLLPSG